MPVTKGVSTTELLRLSVELLIVLLAFPLVLLAIASGFICENLVTGWRRGYQLSKEIGER